MGEGSGDGRIPFGKILIDFSEAVLGDDDTALSAARLAVHEQMGDAALVDAARPGRDGASEDAAVAEPADAGLSIPDGSSQGLEPRGGGCLFSSGTGDRQGPPLALLLLGVARRRRRGRGPSSRA